MIPVKVAHSKGLSRFNFGAVQIKILSIALIMTVVISSKELRQFASELKKKLSLGKKA